MVMLPFVEIVSPCPTFTKESKMRLILICIVLTLAFVTPASLIAQTIVD